MIEPVIKTENITVYHADAFDVAQKRCSTCKVNQPASAFGKNARKYDGLQNECKKCRSLRYRTNTQAKREYDHSLRAIKKATKEATKKQYEKEHADEIAAEAEKRRMIARRKDTERSRRWARANKDRVAARNKKWRVANRLAVAAHEQRRRAAKSGAGGSFTAEEWKELCRQFGNQCLRCHRTDVKLAADHVLPIVSGGSSDIQNIQPLCLSCNSSKGTKHVDYRL